MKQLIKKYGFTDKQANTTEKVVRGLLIGLLLATALIDVFLFAVISVIVILRIRFKDRDTASDSEVEYDDLDPSQNMLHAMYHRGDYIPFEDD